MKKDYSPLIITPGDPRGIGPEVLIKALKFFYKKNKKNLPFICIGAAKPFTSCKLPIIDLPGSPDELKKIFPSIYKKNKTRLGLFLIPAPEHSDSTLTPGYQSGWSIEKAVQLIQAGFSKALVTGPIHKESLIKSGFPYPGHTEFLGALSKTKNMTMMLLNDSLRVSLVTTHIPLHQVSSKLSEEKITDTIQNTVYFLKNQLKIKKPLLTVCALNPHGGEGGALGTEEQKVIVPTLEKLKKKYKNAVTFQGPFPADSLFAMDRRSKKPADAVICMYHDQGLIPLKLLDFNRSVNITLGLPFIRTSVDHGVGFDLAGKNQAHPESMIAAILLAQRLLKS